MIDDGLDAGRIAFLTLWVAADRRGHLRVYGLTNDNRVLRYNAHGMHDVPWNDYQEDAARMIAQMMKMQQLCFWAGVGNPTFWTELDDARDYPNGEPPRRELGAPDLDIPEFDRVASPYA